MTNETPYTLAQLATILSALDGQRRNPNTKRNALSAIGRKPSRSTSRSRRCSPPPTACSTAE